MQKFKRTLDKVTYCLVSFYLILMLLTAISVYIGKAYKGYAESILNISLAVSVYMVFYLIVSSIIKDEE